MSQWISLTGAQWHCSLCPSSGGSWNSDRHVNGPRHRKKSAAVQGGLLVAATSAASLPIPLPPLPPLPLSATASPRSVLSSARSWGLLRLLYLRHPPAGQ